MNQCEALAVGWEEGVLAVLLLIVGDLLAAWIKEFVILELVCWWV